MNEQELYAYLDGMNISYDKLEHPAVFTVEEADLYTADAPGEGTKNLFLCDDKKKHYLLVTVPSHKRVDIRTFGNNMGLKKLHFASADALLELLGLTPGAVTLMGLVNDTAGQVKFYMDRELQDAQTLQCHPLVNTATLVIGMADLHRLLEAVDHRLAFVTIPELAG